MDGVEHGKRVAYYLELLTKKKKSSQRCLDVEVEEELEGTNLEEADREHICAASSDDDMATADEEDEEMHRRLFGDDSASESPGPEPEVAELPEQAEQPGTDQEPDLDLAALQDPEDVLLSPLLQAQQQDVLRLLSPLLEPAPPPLLEPPHPEVPEAPPAVDLFAEADVADDAERPSEREQGRGSRRQVHQKSIRGWGAFDFTYVPPSAEGTHGAWQAFCPFHRSSRFTLCKKRLNIRGATEADEEDALLRLKNWAIAAQKVNRRYLHKAMDPKAGPNLSASLTTIWHLRSQVSVRAAGLLLWLTYVCKQ